MHFYTCTNKRIKNTRKKSKDETQTKIQKTRTRDKT